MTTTDTPRTHLFGTPNDSVAPEELLKRNTTTDTPRTDAYARHWPSETECVPSTIARQLERELNERYKAISEADERAKKAEAEIKKLHNVIRDEWPQDQAEEIITNCKK